jgi:hypothetical protein
MTPTIQEPVTGRELGDSCRSERAVGDRSPDWAMGGAHAPPAFLPVNTRSTSTRLARADAGGVHSGRNGPIERAESCRL